MRAYIGTLLLCTLLVCAMLLMEHVIDDFPSAFRQAAFQVVSVATTTGYATVDYLAWPVFAPVFMLLLAFRMPL